MYTEKLITQRDLEAYEVTLEKFASSGDETLFINDGKKYASILMSVMLRHTEKEIRLFCCGFKEDLITTQPYWNSLVEYLKDAKKRFMVLVETDSYKEQAPMQLLLREKAKRGDDTISVKLITAEDKKLINDKVVEEHCNFGVFDGNKFRFEYDPENFRAYGSFNKPNTCKFLTEIFDSAFNNPQARVLV